MQAKLTSLWLIILLSEISFGVTFSEFFIFGGTLFLSIGLTMNQDQQDDRDMRRKTSKCYVVFHAAV